MELANLIVSGVAVLGVGALFVRLERIARLEVHVGELARRVTSIESKMEKHA